MINCEIIPSKLQCNICGQYQHIESTHCKACGKSFIFGGEDAWTSTVYSAFVPKVDDEVDKEINEYFNKKDALKAVKRLVEAKPLDADLAKIVSDNFMDLLDDADEDKK